jgi:hypothetical protein
MNDDDNTMPVDEAIPQDEDTLSRGENVYEIGNLGASIETGSVSVDDFQEATEEDLSEEGAAEKAATPEEDAGETAASQDWALSEMEDDPELDGWSKDYE